MKSIKQSGPHCFLCAVFLAFAAHARETVQTIPLDYDRNRIEIVTTQLNEQGFWIPQTNSYTQLETGLNYWSEENKGSWTPSSEEIAVVDAGAAALRSPHKVIFARTLDDPNGSVDLLTSDGSRLRSSVLSIGYFDPMSGQRVTIGLVKDVPGELIPPNQVIYRDAFQSVDPEQVIDCDVVYTFLRSGLEQDIVIRKVLPLPDDFGLPGQVSRLEVMTEFYEAPEPVRSSKLLQYIEEEQLRAQVASPDWHDETLLFGGAAMAEGRAFWLGEKPENMLGKEKAAVVGKQWLESDGRKILLEAVDFMDVVPLLFDLLPQGAAIKQLEAYRALMAQVHSGKTRQDRLAHESNQRKQQHASIKFMVPSRTSHLGRTNLPKPMQLASLPINATPGVVLDYRMVAINSTNFTFRGDETYHVNNMINLYGKTTLEGGSVIKFSRYTGASEIQMNIYGTFDCATSSYRPAIFTACDDQSVGQYITNSTAAPDPAIIYSTSAIHFLGDPSAVLLENVRLRHAHAGVLFNGRNGTIRHAQFETCNYPLWAYGPNTAKAHNILISHVKPGGAGFWMRNYASLSVEHATIVNSPNLGLIEPTATVTMRNSILSGISTNQGYVGRNDPLYGNAESGTTNHFQAVGAGNFYLPTGSTNINAGVIGIDDLLKADLKQLTTQAPLLLTNDIVIDTVLGPSVPRDIDKPDRGYHYSPLDYCTTSINLTNCTLTLTNGVALGVFGPKGILLRQNAKLISEGAAVRKNRLVRYNTVQENPFNWGGASTNYFSFLEVTAPGTQVPSVTMRFTEITHLAITTYDTTRRTLLVTTTNAPVRPFSMSHCELGGVRLGIIWTGTENQTIIFTNNLFQNCLTYMWNVNGGTGSLQVAMLNNSFHKGYLGIWNFVSPLWEIADNLIDVELLDRSGTFAATNNAFASGLTAFGIQARTNIQPDYVKGPLGRFYYPITGSSSSLTNLINAGSRTAAVAGLYHFTTRADQQKETNSIVDIGFHYPSTGETSIGLLALYDFNEGSGSTAGDKTGNGHTATLYNGTIWTTGPQGTAVSFDGYNDYVDVADHSSLRLTNAFSIALWVRKLSELAYWQPYIVKQTNLLSRNYWLGDWSSTSGVGIGGYTDTSGTQRTVSTLSEVPLNNWTHLTWTWDGTIQRIYLNGNLEGTFAASGYTAATSTASIGIGGYPYSAASMHGALDAVRIYNRAISPLDVQGLFTSTAADSDGDGLPDVLEDRNGNGTTDGAETDWTSSGSGVGGAANLLVFTPLQ